MVLAIETSCDETSAAVVASGRVLSTVVSSQVHLHAEYGGVVPELATREHLKHLLPVCRAALDQAGAAMDQVSAVAATRGPGLPAALRAGFTTAAALAFALNRPLFGIHHHQAHLYSPWITGSPPRAEWEALEPNVSLIVSGGHTLLVEVASDRTHRVLGGTLDDAAGECFDKTAKLLGLGYPGGPALARLADFGDESSFSLPRPLLASGDLDFSFAGLKTAVLNQVKRLGSNVCYQNRADLAAATQAAIVDVLAAKSLRALERTGLERLVVAGGVGANQRLRGQLDAGAGRVGARVHYPPLALCTDNGAMIALAAAMRWQRGLLQPQPAAFDVRPRWPLQTA
ncbi:MAG: tRNA (adenosine(37)-N6)-threonylcarbamoyltransferase complex transferase subunit TsaD [Rubrivivax sp.]|nr:tRNA (adenosine(37)-N6)-threonylcarbamoyltransferase complex transferase subunit TsaD [Rubrivivax sp.]